MSYWPVHSWWHFSKYFPPVLFAALVRQKFLDNQSGVCWEKIFCMQLLRLVDRHIYCNIIVRARVVQWNTAGLRITRPWVRAPLVPTCLYPWARYLVSTASFTWAHHGGIGLGKYYSLSADKVCTWPVAPLGEVKWLWRFSWYRNDRQQRFVSSGKRGYTNADYYYLLLLLMIDIHT